MMNQDKNGTMMFYLLPFFLFLTITSVQQVFAQEKTCVTGNCHSSMGQDKVVHRPVKDGCMACHQAIQEPAERKTKHPGNLTISLVRQGENLCAMCHKPMNTKKVVHGPISGGGCVACHNPHQSPNKAMLKEIIPKLCFRCHPDSMMKQQVMHPPVVPGDCSSCHENHQSDNPGLLKQEGNSHCLSCHTKMRDSMMTKKTVHASVQRSCTQCHRSHGSPNKSLLTATVPALCSSCHPNETALAEKAVTKHGPMSDAKSCMNCHDPHFSDFPKLLPSAQTALCVGCHNKEMDTESGKLKDLKAFLEANKGGQGPLKGKACVTCHNPHGSDYWRLLVKYYAPTFYTPYSNGNYALCFSCHAKEAFTERKTEQATNFRNKSKNLHFRHVNNNSKGRTCRACHEVCAECQSTGRPNHVKESVGFSTWSMPMNYSPGKDGATCAPGCHGEKQYSRQKTTR